MIQVFIPAPELPLVRRRKTGKLTKQNPWLTANQKSMHRMQEANLTRLWRAEAAAVFEGLPPMGQVHITAHVWRERNGRYDPNNFAPTSKACVDGIVSVGFLADDAHEYVIGPDMRHGGKGRPGLLFTVTEISETP